MEPAIFILQNSSRKYLCHRDFFEKCNAENLQDFAQTQFDFQFLLDNCYQNVNADGDPPGNSKVDWRVMDGLREVTDGLQGIEAYAVARLKM